MGCLGRSSFQESNVLAFAAVVTCYTCSVSHHLAADADGDGKLCRAQQQQTLLLVWTMGGPNICVVGGGVVGLTTAVMLQEQAPKAQVCRGGRRADYWLLTSLGEDSVWQVESGHHEQCGCRHLPVGATRPGPRHRWPDTHSGGWPLFTAILTNYGETTDSWPDPTSPVWPLVTSSVQTEGGRMTPGGGSPRCRLRTSP